MDFSPSRESSKHFPWRECLGVSRLTVCSLTAERVELRRLFPLYGPSFSMSQVHWSMCTCLFLLSRQRTKRSTQLRCSGPAKWAPWLTCGGTETTRRWAGRPGSGQWQRCNLCLLEPSRMRWLMALSLSVASASRPAGHLRSKTSPGSSLSSASIYLF